MAPTRLRNSYMLSGKGLGYPVFKITFAGSFSISRKSIKNKFWFLQKFTDLKLISINMYTFYINHYSIYKKRKVKCF